MKKNFTSIILILITSVFNGAYSQVSISVIPDTPLDYFVFETTTPQLKEGYNSRENYYSTILLGNITARKYSDLPIYDYYAEKVSFIGELDARTQINRTASYVAYTLEARQSSTDPYGVYAKDTFFLNGAQITSISETIYDGSDISYAKYSVSYHSNGKIEEIKYESGEGQSFTFGGLKVVYNQNNTIQSDTIYRRGYGNGDWNAIDRFEYKEYFYNSGNPLKADSAFSYSEIAEPKQSERQYFTSNVNNEITEIKFYTYDSGSDDFQAANTFKFGEEVISFIEGGTSIEEVLLYPNPAQETIFINNNILSGNYFIYDDKGQCISEGIYSGLTGIPVLTLGTGNYMVRIRENNKEWTGRFVK